MTRLKIQPAMKTNQINGKNTKKRGRRSCFVRGVKGYGGEDRNKPSHRGQNHDDRIANLQEQGLQSMEGNKTRLAFDQENNERRNPRADQLQSIGQSRHGPFILRRR